MKRIVVLSDIQAPYEDRRALKAVTRFVGEYQPDELVQIGDLADYPQPSRWSKDSAAEFQGSVFADSQYIVDKVLAPIRSVYAGPFGVIEGNHDERPRVYLAKYAPALAESKAFHMDSLLQFDQLGINWLPDFYDFAPGWVMTHGHKGGIRLTQEPGKTALNAATGKFLKSVIMGHTHRLGAMTRSFGYDQKISRMITGVEVGNLMNMRLAGYLKGGAANWQSGFVIVYVDGNYVRPDLIPIMNGRFTVEGETYTI